MKTRTNIINEYKLLSEIRRIVEEELKKKLPDNQINALWTYLNQIDERLKCMEFDAGIKPRRRGKKI